MTRDDGPQNCRVCDRQFNSDRELQEHQNDAYSQGTPGKQPAYGADQGVAERARSSEVEN
jgi:hypothetical protein